MGVSSYEAWQAAHLFSRRRALSFFVGSALGAAAAPAQDSAHSMFSKVNEADVARPVPNMHDGRGTISFRYFEFDRQPAPANFCIYDIPPGASEGVHTHHLGDTVLGPYDEYYYIIEGEGEMPIDGQTVPVKTGDHVHTPLGVAHGITNTSKDKNLRVFLTFIARA